MKEEKEKHAIHKKIDQLKEASYRTTLAKESFNTELAERMQYVIREFTQCTDQIRGAKPYQQVYLLYSFVDGFAGLDKEEREFADLFEEEVALISELKPLPGKKDLLDFYTKLDVLRSQVNQCPIKLSNGDEVHVWDKLSKQKEKFPVEDVEKLREQREAARGILVSGLDELLETKGTGGVARVPILHWILFTFKRAIIQFDHIRFFMDEKRWTGARHRAQNKELMVWTCIGSLLRSFVEDGSLEIRELDITPEHGKLGAGLRLLSFQVMPKFCSALQQYRGVLLSQALEAGNLKNKVLAAMVTASFGILQCALKYMFFTGTHSK